MENFVRTKLKVILPGILKSKETSDTHFFGSFAKNEDEFKFSLDERNIINRVAAYVQCHKPGNNQGINETGASFMDEFFTDDQIDVETTPISTKNSESKTINDQESTTHTLLNKLLMIANTNVRRSKHGYRFDNGISNAATALRILVGPSTYKMIQWNLKLCLPSLSSTNRHIGNNKKQIEGHLAVKELSNYLKRRNLPPLVALSEDATRVTSRIQYDSKKNEVIGFVLPVNVENCMPLTHKFKARNASEICRHFNGSNDPAQSANVIMAQPVGNCPPFCLLLFGTNGQYTAEDIAIRWNYITNALAEENIEVLTISCDSDPKQNSAMRKCSGLGTKSDIFGDVEWFNMNASEDTIYSSPFYVQDTAHIATKMRNLFLTTKKNMNKLRFGHFYIRIQHLEFLLNHFSKDKHELTATILNSFDRQNFQSVLRICDEKVIHLLKMYVSDSKGTVKFLEMLRDIIDAFTNTELSPMERVRKMWYPVFVIRIWRLFVETLPTKSVKNNFITQNCYSCIEINAHSLLLIMVYLKDRDLDHLFLPHLFDSQPCESFFRKIRSMTSTYCTVTNCSIKEMLDRIHRLIYLDENPLQTDVAYPRIIKKNKCGRCNFTLPSIQEIIDEIEACKSDAIKYALEVGLITRKNEKSISLTCGIDKLPFRNNERSWLDIDEESETSAIYEDEVEPKQVPEQELRLDSLLLPNFAEKFIDQEIPDTSPYVEVFYDGIKRIVVKKSSLCWVLRPPAMKLSSDRLRRVQAKIYSRLKRPTGKRQCKKFRTDKVPAKLPKRVLHYKKK